MGFWHTGYMEFHEPTGLETSYVPSKIWYSCQQCGEQYETMEALRQHRFESHPIANPLFFIRGAGVGAATFTITQKLSASDIQFDRATLARVNEKTVPLKGLARHVAAVTRDRIKVELSNEGARVVFDLLFEVASDKHLIGVEAAFLDLARGRQLTIQSIEIFINACRAFSSAARYCDGLCHYLYGVLAKERAGDSGLEFDEYRNRYSRAAEELKGFERPLARLVRALVAFHFNQFEDAYALAPTGRLRRAAGAYAGAIGGQAWKQHDVIDGEPANALEDLLTDHEALRILEWATLSAQELGPKAGSITNHLERNIPAFDRVKLLVLVGEGSSCSGDVAAARRAARELIGNAKTSVWAEALLARLTDGN